MWVSLHAMRWIRELVPDSLLPRRAAEALQARRITSRSQAVTRLRRCTAGESATTSRPAAFHLAAKGEFYVYATTTKHFCRSLLVAKCLGATGDSSSAGSTSSGAIRRILP